MIGLSSLHRIWPMLLCLPIVQSILDEEMANRPRGYGMTAEIEMATKYDLDLEQQARIWIQSVLEEPLVEDADPDKPLGEKLFHECLKDGVILCRLANKVIGPVEHSTMKMKFAQMDNINKFLAACGTYGVPKADLFKTVDLYENQNMFQVVSAIHALGRKAQDHGYKGPTLRTRESQANKRTFSEEEMKAGESVIGLQMGTNEGASQSGLNVGLTRSIVDDTP